MRSPPVGLLLAGQLALRARTRLFGQCPFQIAYHEVPLGSADSGETDPDCPGNLLVAAASIGRQQNLRPLELAGGVFATAEHPRQFITLGWAQFDPITYIHALPPCRRPG